MRFLFYGNAYNMGDVGIGASILADLRALGPPVELRVVTDTPALYRRLPACQGATVVDRASLWPGGWKRWRSALSAATGNLSWLPPERLRRLEEHYRWADVVVYQGGPHWNDVWLDVPSFGQHMLHAAVAEYFARPVALVSHGFGPFAWAGPSGSLRRRLASIVLRKMSLLVARDRSSLGALEHLGIDMSKVMMAPDAALRLRPESPAKGREILNRFGIRGGERPLVALAVRAMSPRYGITRAEQEHFHHEWGRFADQIIEQVGDAFFLSTHCASSGGLASDLELMSEIRRGMQYGDRLGWIDQDLLPGEIAAVYGQADVLVSARLHPLVFAVGQATPVLGLDYQPKSVYFMAEMGLEDWLLSYRSFCAEEAVARLEEVLRRQSEIEDHIERRVAEHRQAAWEAIEAVAALAAPAAT